MGHDVGRTDCDKSAGVIPFVEATDLFCSIRSWTILEAAMLIKVTKITDKTSTLIDIAARADESAPHHRGGPRFSYLAPLRASFETLTDIR